MIVLSYLHSLILAPSRRKFGPDYLNVTVNEWQVLIYQTSHVVIDRGRSTRLHNPKLIQDFGT